MTIKLDIATKHILWLKRTLELNHKIDNIEDTEKKKYIRKVTRGNVYLCDFGMGIGSEYQKANRPCVVIQNRIANVSSPIVIVAPITHTKKEYPTIVELTSEVNTSSQDDSSENTSYANLSQIMTISKIRLGNFICNLNKEDMKNIDIALAKSIDLFQYNIKYEKQIKHKEKHVQALKKQLNEKECALQKIKTDLNVENIDEAIEKIHVLLDNYQKDK